MCFYKGLVLLNGAQLKFPSLNSVAINASGEIHTYPTATRIINYGVSTPSVLTTTEQTHPVGCWTVCELHVSLFMTRLWKILSLQSSWTAVCFSSLPSAPVASTNERNRKMLSVWSLNCHMEHYRLSDFMSNNIKNLCQTYFQLEVYIVIWSITDFRVYFT